MGTELQALGIGTVVSVTPVGKGVTVWLDWATGWHKMITDHDRKRKYVDGKRVPWAWHADMLK